MVEAESAVKRESNPATNEQLGQISNWRGFNNPWLPDDDQAVDFSYVNLVENPERYTGYKVSWPQSHSIGADPDLSGLAAFTAEKSLNDAIFTAAICSG